jgi:hypothetical protein
VPWNLLDSHQHTNSQQLFSLFSVLSGNGFQSPERPLNCRWWRNQHFKIGQGKGLSTHRRMDGSWRTEHPAYEDVLAESP